MKHTFYPLLGLLYLATACQPQELTVPDGPMGSARVAAGSSFAPRVRKGEVADPTLDEISGVAASRRNPGLLWVNEDSGNPNKLYLLSENGATRATFTLPAKTKAGQDISTRDWEDIAVGPGPSSGTWYIYLANIGDNGANNTRFYVYRIQEPSVSGLAANAKVTLASSQVEQLEFEYADKPRNAETLMIHPQTRDLYIITKEDNTSQEQNAYSSKGGIYRAAYPQSTSRTTQLGRLGAVNVLTATGGDISPDGNEVLIQNYDKVYAWKRTSNSQSITAILTQTSPSNPPYVADQENNATERSGEAICWAADGSGFYTISEKKGGTSVPIYFYKKQ
ncbi:hypothetical protein ACFSUS_28575 [Spirosoma soli]|uniref:PE-PGRS family protein n=1 Tax=Spirosoma soli TaxID=1770529 RepID=A0ABW5MDQ5_9BACT